jgi:hypothetical protein
MTGAVKQHHVQLFFQLLHGVAQRRRNAPQFICRSSKAAAPVNRVHDAKRLKRQCSLFAISFSFRKFEHTGQNIWLTMKRPYLYHCFSVKRGQVYDYDKNS